MCCVLWYQTPQPLVLIASQNNSPGHGKTLTKNQKLLLAEYFRAGAESCCSGSGVWLCPSAP